jgi:hypothetical protein
MTGISKVHLRLRVLAAAGLSARFASSHFDEVFGLEVLKKRDARDGCV